MRPGLCGARESRAGRGEQPRAAETTKSDGWKGQCEAGTDRARPAVYPRLRPLLAQGRGAPAGRAGNLGSFPAAPSPPSPRLLPGLPEAAPHPTSKTPLALRPRSQGPPTAEAPSGPPQRKLGGSRPGRAPDPRVSRKLYARVAPLCPEPPRRPGHPHLAARATRLRGGRGERAGREGCPPISGAGRGAPGLEPGADSRRLRPRGRVRRAVVTGVVVAALGLRCSANARGGGENGPSAVPAARGPGAAGTFILTRPAPGSA